ncbi:MAG: PQQ-binding-like beta-propeller repeat protein, partial [Verrucomicrobiota bacterium]
GGKGKAAAVLTLDAEKGLSSPYSLGLGDGLGYVPTPIIHAGLIYLWGDSGVLTVRKATSGEFVYEDRVGGDFFSSPIILDGKIYAGSRNGELVAVSLGETFEVLGRASFPGGIYATPAAANGYLVIRTETHLIGVKGK